MTKQLVRNQDLASDVFRRNLAVNGNLENWQRGNGPFTVAGAYGPDRWVLEIIGTGAISVSKDLTNNDVVGLACAALTITGADAPTGNNYASLYQKVEVGPELRGKYATFSARIRGSVAHSTTYTGVAIFIYTLGAVNNVGPFIYGSGSGTYETMSTTFLIPVNCTAIDIYVRAFSNGTYYLDNVTLVPGQIALDYQPLHPDEDVARCKRYYNWTGDANDGSVAITGWAGDASAYWWPLGWFPSEMPVTPTMTKVGTWGATNCGQPTLWGSARYWGLSITSVAAGKYSLSCAALGQRATFEANP